MQLRLRKGAAFVSGDVHQPGFFACLVDHRGRAAAESEPHSKIKYLFCDFREARVFVFFALG